MNGASSIEFMLKGRSNVQIRLVALSRGSFFFSGLLFKSRTCSFISKNVV